jgi:hypothetical protein
VIRNREALMVRRDRLPGTGAVFDRHTVPTTLTEKQEIVPFV